MISFSPVLAKSAVSGSVSGAGRRAFADYQFHRQDRLDVDVIRRLAVQEPQQDFGGGASSAMLLDPNGCQLRPDQVEEGHVVEAG